MPTPGKNESEKDFVQRCIPIVIEEGTAKDGEQAAAICHSMFREKKEMKLETVNLGNVEIFEAGTWKGEKYTEKDIDEMIENFNNRVAEPYITIDHSKKATKQMKDALQALSLGFVSKLRRAGTKLIADFKQVPKTIADLVGAGALKKKSIEFFKQFISNGKLYRMVLQGVTFHGANGLPEVNTLSDFLSLYKKDLVTMAKPEDGIVSLKNSDFKEENMSDDLIKMKDETISTLKNQIVKLEADKEAADEAVKAAEEEIAEKDKVIEEKDKEIEEKDKQIEEVEKEKEENLKKEAETYIDKQINDGKIQPAHKERYVSEYIQYKKDDKLFKDFTEDIENRGKVINFKPTEYPEIKCSIKSP